MKGHRRAFLAIWLLSILVLGGCAVESDRSDKPAPDWSRGLRLGRTNLKQPVALQVDAQKHVHMVWCADGLQYAHLDDQAHVVSNGPLDVDTVLPRQPQLLVDAQDNIHLAWLSRQNDMQRLYYYSLRPTSGSALPLAISGEHENVSSFRMYLSPDDQVSFLWASESEGGSGGLVHANLRQQSLTTILVQQAIDPFVLVDRAGTVHVTWLRARGLTARTIYYAILDESGTRPRLAPAEGVKLADFEFGESAVYYGPIIGLDSEHIYVIWSEQNLGGGLTPTAAFSYYVAFQPGHASVTNPGEIGLPSASRPVYEDYASGYGFTKLDLLVPLDLAYGSDFVNSPATVTTQQDELPVVFSLMTQSQSQSEIQLATAIFRDGQEVGYQLSSKTPNASLMPAIAADPDANLHLAWIDTAGFAEYDVYYASMSPEARRWLDRTSTDDLVLGAANVLFAVLSGIGLVPIAGIWSFPPLIWVVVFFIFSGQEEMDRTPTRIGFLIAVVIYVGMKVLLLPGLFAGTPLLYAVPREWATFVGIAVPVAILLLALLAVHIYSRRAQRATIFKAFVIFALTDVVLTLVLYAPGFFGQG